MIKKGLTDKEVIEQRKKYGSNIVSKRKQNSFVKLFLETLGDPIIKILLIALCIKTIFLFRDFNYFETIGIAISILIASLVSTISEYGSEAAFRKLEEESSHIKVKAFRNNQQVQINIEEVVVKDLIILNAGDKVPADGTIIKGTLSTDESTINGETKSKEKAEKSKLFRGTTILEGEAIMEVDKVGKETIYGNIAEELQSESGSSPLKERLTKLANQISKIGYIGALLVVFSFLFSKIIINNNFDKSLILADITNLRIILKYLIQALTIAVTIIIVSVPEGLPLMITLVLSSNMRRMLKNNVLVRKLVGIETAGNLNYLLTDKTGTLTMGKLSVTNIITNNKHDIKNFSELKQIPLYEEIYKSLYFNNSSNYNKKNEIIGGNSTDQALLGFIKEDLNINPKIIKYQPFNSQNKYSYVTLEENNTTTYIKGAPEILLSKCTTYLDEYGREKNFYNKDYINNILKEKTSSGYRVIAICTSKTFHITQNLNRLCFIGLILIKDIIRPEAYESLKIIKKSGINTIMITGDDKETAISIAKELNIINNQEDIILTSTEFNSLSDEELISIHKNIKVIARALPNDKSRLVKVLKNLNYIVGMTGDGINDASALKKADVGFAMGSGTEVAKEAGDIVILDDNINSIVKAILYGRTIFKSIRKFIIFQLSVNICAITISIIGPFIGFETPITIVQMLWINMIMDTLAGIAFSYEPPLEEYLNEPPISRQEPIIDNYMRNEIIISGIYQAIICILYLKIPFIKNLIRYDPSNHYFLTSYFSLFVFLGLFNAFNARTKRINILANIRSNIPFIIITMLIFITQIFIIYCGGNLFRTYGLTIKELLFVLSISFTIIPFDWLRKYLIKDR